MPAARHPPPALCRERLLSARYAGATPLPPELPGWGSGGPPAHPHQGTLPGMAAACKEGPGRGRLAVWAQPRVAGKRLRPWASVSSLDGDRGPSRPVPSPSPRGCREEREPGRRGAGAQPAKMRPQGVLWLSRLSQEEFHARPAGPFITWPRLPTPDSVHLAMMNGCSSGWKAWERGDRGARQRLQGTGGQSGCGRPPGKGPWSTQPSLCPSRRAGQEVLHIPPETSDTGGNPGWPRRRAPVS